MATLIDLKNMFIYYDELEHQNAAIKTLYEGINPQTLDKALSLYRDNKQPKIDPNQLTKNFYLWEFEASETAERHGIDNSIPIYLIPRIKKLCDDILQPTRDALGSIKISSGYRSPALNAVTPGASKISDHCQCYAVDLQAYKCSNLVLAQFIAKNFEFDQLIVEYGTHDNPAWIHISNNPKMRHQILRKTYTLNYAPYSLF